MRATPRGGTVCPMPRVRARFLVLLLLLVGCLGSDGPTAPPAGGHHVLFLGNSLTYTNDLARTLSDVAALGGDTIHAEMVAYPNFAIEDHLAAGTAQQAIAVGGWEYVILQQGPSALESSRQNLIAATQAVDPLVRQIGARTGLYMVWPAKVNFGDFPRVGGSYLLAAQSVDGVFFPVGLAWIAAWDRDPSLPLYGSDDFHPSPLGTYLAALVIYEKVTGKDARDLPPTLTADGLIWRQVSAETVRMLQEAAHEANVAYP